MKTNVSFGTALLLAAVFLLHPVALCAAGNKAESARVHACCQKETAPARKSSEAPCCKISSLPASQGVAEVAGIVALPELPASVEVSAAPRFEGFTPRALLLSPPPFFLQFHQLLI